MDKKPGIQLASRIGLLILARHTEEIHDILIAIIDPHYHIFFERLDRTTHIDFYYHEDCALAHLLLLRFLQIF